MIEELILSLPQENFLLALWHLFIKGGWIIFACLLPFLLEDLWLQYIQNKWSKKIKYTLLAIDVPRLTEPSMTQVEHIFSHLAGIYSEPDFKETYWEGEYPLSISLEIISIDGNIQFLIYTPEKFRDLVESAIYAQYPEAEIMPVEDYTENIPSHREFPHKDYVLYSADFTFINKNPYPIRTYPEFEYKLTQKFADPLASLLEQLSHLREGEQLWIQIVIMPASNEWKKEGEEIVKKLVGARVKEGGGIFSEFIDIGQRIIKGLTESFVPGADLGGIEGKAKREEEGPPTLIQYLTPGEVAIVQGIQNKISKIGFKCNMRFVYVARREVAQASERVTSIEGIFSQFNTLNMNGFKFDKKTKTKADYFFVKQRVAFKQRRQLRRYRERADHLTTGKYIILNTEELASIFHFPTEGVKAPLVKTIETRRGEPPVALPVAGEGKVSYVSPPPTVKGSPPPELPVA